MLHRFVPPLLALSLAACVEDPAELGEADLEVRGTGQQYRVPGMVRFRTTDDYGTDRWVTGLLVAPTGQTRSEFSSRIVITSSMVFPPRYGNACIPRPTVELGWTNTALPLQNRVTTARVVDQIRHPFLPIVALVLDAPLTTERTFTPAAGLPTGIPGDGLYCHGYNASGNLVYTRGSSLGSSRFGYLYDASSFYIHDLVGRDGGFMCTDALATTWYGVNLMEWWRETTDRRDLDGDGRADNEESRLACIEENAGRPASGRCVTSHASAATLAPWIDAQSRVVSLVSPTQFTTRLWFESAANPVCADIPSESFADADVNQWTCHRRANQQFFEIPAGNGVAWVNANSGKCWTASNGGIVQRTCNAADPMQQWTSTPTASPAPAGRVLRNLGAGTCVTAQGSAISVQLRLTACPTPTAAPPAQVWKTNHGLTWCL